MQRSAKITTLATILTGTLYNTNDALAADNDSEEILRYIGYLSLNWGGVMGEDLPYKRFATGVDGGVGYRLGPYSLASIGLTTGIHKLKEEKGPGPDGLFVSAGPTVGLTFVYLNVHWAGAYEFNKQSWETGPEIGVTAGLGLYVHAGVFIPDYPNRNLNTAALTARLGMGI